MERRAPLKSEKARNYKQRKKDAIEAASNALRTRGDELGIAHSEKADDLADAYLLALQFNSPNESFQGEQTSSAITTVKARKPTHKQERSGQYSLSNCKHLLKHGTESDLPERRLNNSVARHFGNISHDEARRRLGA